jgi:hypothetical protein
MQCEKCHGGEMRPTKVFRLSGCLATLGFFLLIPCFLLLCFALLFGALGMAATGSASVKVTEQAKQDAITKLRAMEGIPPGVISNFQPTARVSDTSLTALEPPQREQVHQIQSSYDAQVAGAAVGTGFAALFGGGLVIIMFVIAIPGLIIGFVLILRKKVWKCQTCGYIFERA